ncbi:hypothetical protein [Dyadobacter sp. MSC1_007]|jgi:hypothetical protein|uniref:hypothetical protein n=1 Tax=Dyadobacter sp. MSC1_007 TaxID=2909264 RepID=UPI00202F7996|nr:hypothetical protein [Dyadobacter sp. MSC1_007]
MNRYSKYNLTPAQQEIVDKKVKSLAKAVKNIDLNNLPKREDHREAYRPADGSKRTEKA